MKISLPETSLTRVERAKNHASNQLKLFSEGSEKTAFAQIHGQSFISIIGLCVVATARTLSTVLCGGKV